MGDPSPEKAGNPDSLRLGFGSLSAEPIAVVWARQEFFSATRRVAADALEALREKSMPLYEEARRRNPKELRGCCFPATVIEASGRGWRETWLLVVEDWPSLCEGANHKPYLRDLKDSVHQWVQDHNLTDSWLLESILRVLSGWCGDRVLLQKLDWRYPSSSGSGGNSLSVSGLGLRSFSYRHQLPSPLPYDPGSETWDKYISSLENYRTEIE